MNRKRYFFDMDGVLAKYNFDLPSFDTLYEEGYFLNRPPQLNIIEAAKLLIDQKQEVFILSAVLKDSEYALFEKHEWLDQYLPLPCKNRIFTLCGEDKISYVPAFDPKRDILIDDFGENCRTWEAQGGEYVKVSRDVSDGIYEANKHRFVIYPNMRPEDIVYVIKEVGRI